MILWLAGVLAVGAILWAYDRWRGLVNGVLSG